MPRTRITTTTTTRTTTRRTTSALALLAATLVALLPARCPAFNVDPQHAVVVPSPSAPNLLFGYSVALGPQQLLVGEPKGGWLNRPELHAPGTLYRCSLAGAPASPSRCLPALLDQTGNEVTYIGGHRVQHFKNDSMFGSTVVTTSSGLALVCGPGWKNQLYRYKYYLMNGLCYSLLLARDDHRPPKPDAPLVENEKQGQWVDEPGGAKRNVFYYAFGEAGFSAHISEEAGEVLLGAPGVYYWRGSAVRYRLNEAGQLVEQFVTRPDTLEDYSYFGYSVTAGRFVPDVGRQARVQYAAGAPRASDVGKVVLFDLPDGAAAAGRMTVLQEVFGEQLGEYFGAAVLAEDVTGDGLADLLVGAPLHSTPQAGDAGRVYVYVNLGDGHLELSGAPLTSSAPRRPAPASGQHGHAGGHGGRFGYAIASAGDSNKDGYNDVWVGAPYEDGGRGAVYLFLGSPLGLRAAQRLAAGEVHAELRSFGFSLTASADVDGNGYADLAVGAPLSGHAVVLLARPAARLAPRISSSVAELSLGAASFVVTACLRYTGHRAQPEAVAEVTLSLDGPPSSLERAALLPLQPLQLRPGGPAARPGAARQLRFAQRLRLDKLVCTDATVLIRQHSRTDRTDYTTPIDVTMRFNLSDEASRRDHPFCASCPVLDPMAPSSASLRVPYATGCANDTYCRPDLRVTADWRDMPLPLVLGSTRGVTLRATVRNLGEPAFLARLAVALPPPLAVARMPAACHAPRGPRHGVSSSSSSSSAAAPAHLLCDLANPLGRDEQVELELPLDVSALSLSDLVDAPWLSLRLNATAGAGGDVRGDDNKDGGEAVVVLRLPLAASVDVDLVGRPSPELGLLPDLTSTKAVAFTHTYEVRHVGATLVLRAALRLLVPAKARVRGVLVPLLEARVLVDRRRVECAAREVTEEQHADDDAKGQPRQRQPAAPRRPLGEQDDDWEDLEAGTVGGGLRCGRHPVVCTELQCPLLLPASRAAATTVALRLRLLTEDLAGLELAAGAVAVHTKAVVVFPDLPTLPAGSKLRTRPVQLTTLFMRPAGPAPVQPWVVGLSAAAGLLLLLLLSLALGKAGFFGRKTVPHVDASAAVVADPGGFPGAGTRRAAGSGRADDDTLLAFKDVGAVVLRGAADGRDVEETASDSGTCVHSSADAATRPGRAWLSAG